MKTSTQKNERQCVDSHKSISEADSNQSSHNTHMQHSHQYDSSSSNEKETCNRNDRVVRSAVFYPHPYQTGFRQILQQHQQDSEINCTTIRGTTQNQYGQPRCARGSYYRDRDYDQ